MEKLECRLLNESVLGSVLCRGDKARDVVETGDSGGEPSQCWLSFRWMVKCLRGTGAMISEWSVSDLSTYSDAMTCVG